MTFSALDSVLTGPLFATAAMTDCFSDTARLKAMLRAEAALARSQAAQQLVPVALAEALDAISPNALDAHGIGRATALAGVPTIPFVQAVQAMLPAELERHFHKGATTQDILDTALVLQCRDAFALIVQDLQTCLTAFSGLAQRNRDTPCVGRTHGQHAAPVTFGYKVAVWLAGLSDAAAALPAIRTELLTASLSGPVGTLAALRGAGPAVLDGFARHLDLAAPPIAWHANRGRIAAAGAWLARLIGAVAKIATDVAHLASTEVAEVSEPYIAGRGGSSAMPHKRNPVSCTVILAAHAAAPGLASTLVTAMAAGHERPPGLWHSEWHALPPLFGLASGVMREARVLAEGLEVDATRMAVNLDATRGLLFADAAAARLTPMGRDAAHKLVEHGAAEVRRTGTPLRDVLATDPAVLASGIDLGPAFDLAPALAAAETWIERAVAEAARAAAAL